MAKHANKQCPVCLGTGIVQDQAELGKELREAREVIAGKSLTYVASRMKISSTYLSELERGKKPWTPTLIAKFRKALTK